MYRIRIKPHAMKDMRRITDYIEYELYNPVAAQRFFDGLDAKINGLKLNAGIFAKSTYEDVLKYDAAARHVTYKGFTIIYSIHDDLVVVHRVIHGSLIRK